MSREICYITKSDCRDYVLVLGVRARTGIDILRSLHDIINFFINPKAVEEWKTVESAISMDVLISDH